MTSSRLPSLDLDAWSNSLPKERANDLEYNLLVYKFKSFIKEVREFQEQHTHCLPTVKAKQQPANIDTQNALNAQKHLSSTTSSSKSTVSPGKGRVSVLAGLLNSQQNQTQPLKQRPQSPVRRAPFLQHQRSTPTSNSLASQPIQRVNSLLCTDDDIYDAVSPDDTTTSDQKLHNGQTVASQSVHNLNLTGPQKQQQSQLKDKTEPSRSVSGLALHIESPQTRTTAHQAQQVNIQGLPIIRLPDQNKSQHSLGSSVNFETSNLTSSSVSLAQNSKQHFSSPLYANYVNIDYFLRRGESPTFDEEATNDEEDGTHETTVTTDDDDDDDEDNDDSGGDDTTQLSHSLSSDQNCESALREMSPRELARKLSCKVEQSSSNSITPASSGDFLDDNRNPTSFSTSSPNRRLINSGFKAPDIYKFNSFENDTTTKDSTVSREVARKYSYNNNIFEPIQEDLTALNLSPKQSSISSSKSEKDDAALFEANNTMRSFLSDLNLTPADDLLEDKAQRRIVKESFAVEFCGRRKLRHLFLFNDVIVCAKYQASSKQKFTFDVKWYLNLNGVSILDVGEISNQVKFDKEAIDNQILAIRTNLMLLRGQMQHLKRSKHKQPSKIIKKLKKKRTELEAELVLLLPHLPLVIKHTNGKKYTFFLSSNFDRNQWIESIKFLQSQLPPTTKGSTSSPSSTELQAWIQTCRKNLNPTLGTFLLRSNCDDDLLYGDLYINLNSIIGISKPGHYYFCFEVDSYGHFSQKASSLVLNIEQSDHELNEEYVFPLDGAHTLRILLYEDLGLNAKPSVVGKSHVELSRSWFLDTPVEKVIPFNSNCSLQTKLSYSSSELLSMRISHTKLCPTFGMDITQVCKKEKTTVPLLIQLCVNEVERRGMREVGIYRMSGTSTDIQRLKKAFETNPYVAELLLRDIDVNSVTGFLKTYLREIPEGLFSNRLYLKFVSAFNIPQSETLERTKAMLELFHMIPITNQQTIIYLVEHLVKVNRYERYNKMSLTNLATVLGPNILKAPTESPASNNSDPFTAVVIGSMSQAGILYFFLNRKSSNLPLMELDSSELARPMEGINKTSPS